MIQRWKSGLSPQRHLLQFQFDLSLMMILTNSVFDVSALHFEQVLLHSSPLHGFDLGLLITPRFFLLERMRTVPHQSFDLIHTGLSLCCGSRRGTEWMIVISIVPWVLTRLLRDCHRSRHWCWWHWGPGKVFWLRLAFLIIIQTQYSAALFPSSPPRRHF